MRLKFAGGNAAELLIGRFHKIILIEFRLKRLQEELREMNLDTLYINVLWR